LRTLIEPFHKELTIEEQCEMLGLPRSSYYYKPIQASPETLALMKRIEEIHHKKPFLGYRRVHEQLCREGVVIGDKKVEHLWALLGFRSILPGPNLSKPGRDPAEKHPYLLDGMWIGRPNQVFSTDITFLPLPTGFVYLATVVDWYSRYILSWEVSNSLSVDFCLKVVEKAFEIAIAEYFNADQGSQFTSEAFINLLKKHGINISFDGKGRAIDNVYQERSWWSLKYEKIYPNCYESVKDMIAAVKEYVWYFNEERPHQALLYATPSEIYHGITPKHCKGVYNGFKVKEAKYKK